MFDTFWTFPLPPHAAYWHMDRDRDFWLLGESVLTSWMQRGAGAVGNTSCKKDRSSSGNQGNDDTVALDRGSVVNPMQYMEVNLERIVQGLVIIVFVVIQYTVQGMHFNS